MISSFKVIFAKIYQKCRVVFYSFLSSKKIGGKKYQPVLVEGVGRIDIADNVSFGVKSSPFFYSGYSYIEARRESSEIVIKSNTYFNNNLSIISDGARIEIGENCLIGTNCEILDSDFHNLNPLKRFGHHNVGVIKKDVSIGNNVFIGNNVTILKGVTIGENSVIANGSIVSKDIPADTISGGNIARIIQKL